MKLFYCRVDGGNFGDDMNEWFWNELFPDHRDIAPDATLFGIGSILWRDNFAGLDRVVVMGSGSGYGVIPNEVPGNAEIGFVRGPRTARLLNLDASVAITDPAAMVPTFKSFDDVTSTGEVVFVPHVGTAKLPLNWDRIADRAGVRYVTPAQDSRDVIRAIAGARLVLAESLHGAILADAFRVPWVPLSISPTFNEHKWRDWSDSLEMEIAFEEFLGGLKKTRALLARLRNVVSGGKGKRAATQKTGSLPHGTHVAPAFSKEAKTAARKWVSTLSPIVETMLVRDLARAQKTTPFLSAETVLRERQSQILDRIDQVRDRLIPSARARSPASGG